MKNVEFTSEELYFLLHYMKELNGKINNKYSNSVLEKIEEAFFVGIKELNNIKEINNGEIFKQEYNCNWIK